MSPMTVAELLLLLVVLAAAPLALPPEFFPLGGACFVPLALLVGWALLQWPSPTRIDTNGIEVSLPAWRRILRERAYLPWSEVRNAYPASYEISGAAMSPFASSAGTLVHVGLGLETTDGRRRTVKFTPGSIRAFRGETPGFTYAMAAVRRALADLGRPLVTHVEPYTDGQILAMHGEARAPLLGLGTIVYAFFLPPSLVAGVLFGLPALGFTLDMPLILAGVGVSPIPPLRSVVIPLQRGRRPD